MWHSCRYLHGLAIKVTVGMRHDMATVPVPRVPAAAQAKRVLCVCQCYGQALLLAYCLRGNDGPGCCCLVLHIGQPGVYLLLQHLAWQKADQTQHLASLIRQSMCRQCVLLASYQDPACEGLRVRGMGALAHARKPNPLQ